jgi:protein involved in polysaccharide export with SLBB domain
MKEFRNMAKAWVAVAGIMWAAVLMTGCETAQPDYVDTDMQTVKGVAVALHTGDTIQISFVAPGSEKIFQPHEERIKEDGTISPPEIGSVRAAGKTAGQLQTDLQKEYDKLYRNVTVTVKAGDRFYYVDGDVKQPGPKPYLGETDVVKAIAAGGGFTDFAKQSKIRLIHPNGRTQVINYGKAIEDSAYNPSVYPGDKIVVPRRIF